MLKTLNIVNQNRWSYYVTGGFFQIRSNTSHHYMYTRNNRLNVQLNIDYRYIYIYISVVFTIKNEWNALSVDAQVRRNKLLRITLRRHLMC